MCNVLKNKKLFQNFIAGLNIPRQGNGIEETLDLFFLNCDGEHVPAPQPADVPGPGEGLQKERTGKMPPGTDGCPPSVVCDPGARWRRPRVWRPFSSYPTSLRHHGA